MTTDTEVPWPAGARDAALLWDPMVRDRYGDAMGHLHFISPANRRAVVHVTRGAHYLDDGLHVNVWHVDEDPDGSHVTISPSIHYVGEFHTPNPVRFRLVPKEEVDAAWEAMHK